MKKLETLSTYLESNGFREESVAVQKLAVMGPSPAQEKKWQSSTQSVSGYDAAHLLLDLLGLVPVYGEAADFANAALYLSKGLTTENILMAALSITSMVPSAGDVTKVLKYGGKLAPEALKEIGLVVWKNQGAIKKVFENLKSAQALAQLQKIPHGKLLAKHADKFWAAIKGWLGNIINYEAKKPVGEAIQSD
jgi:hypothetical protein